MDCANLSDPGPTISTTEQAQTGRNPPYRKRLKVKSGCQRCRIRKTKCIEQRPKCLFCQRWNLDCVWPAPGHGPSKSKNVNHRNPSTSFGDDSVSTQTISHRHQQHNLLFANPGTSSLDPFHNLPIPDRGNGLEIARILYFFFSDMINGSMPFQISIAQRDLAHGFARSIFADPAVCYAFVSYGMNVRLSMGSVSSYQHRALMYETQAISILRDRLHHAQSVSEETLVTASVHFLSFACSRRKVEELSRMCKGIGRIVESQGGYASLSRRLHFSTCTSLQVCDTVTSLWNATKPLYINLSRPERPQSLELLYRKSSGRAFFYDKCSNLMIMETICDMKFVLFFREPSKQTRSFSSEEASYMVLLLQYIDNRLGCLQAQYVETNTLDELVVVSMVLMKLEIVADSCQHPFLVEAVLKRLRRVISSICARADFRNQEVMLWACLVALVGPGFQEQRQWFLDMIAYLLDKNCRSLHSQTCWQKDLEAKLSHLPWHDRLQTRYCKLGGRFKHTNDAHVKVCAL